MMRLLSYFYSYAKFSALLLFTFLNFLFYVFYSVIQYRLEKILLFVKYMLEQKKIDNRVEVLHCSEYFLVVNKPYDMVINSNDPNVEVIKQPP